MATKPILYGWRDVSRLAGLTLAYILLANLALNAFSPNGVVSIIWPPSGLALSALLLDGAKLWPGIFIGALTANVLAGSSLPVSACIAAGNTLEALFGLWYLARFEPSGFSLDAPRDYRKLCVAGIFSACISALIGNTALRIVGFLNWQTFAENLARWWQGDLLGMLLVTPFILVWRRLPRGWFKRARGLETLACFGLSWIFGQVIFLDWFHPYVGMIAFGYWMFMFAAWGALRFGRHGILLIIGMTAMQALWGATHGSGFFGNDVSEAGLLNLWFYLVVLTVLGLTLALTLQARDNAEKELRRSEERYRKLAEDSNDWIWTMDIEGRHTYSNERVLDILGLECEVGSAVDAMSLVHPGDLARYTQTFREAMATGQGWRDVQIRWHTRDGSYRTFESRASAMRDPDGRLVGFQGIDRDITERVRAETRLRLAASVFANSYEGIVMTNADKMIVDVNPAFTRITGYAREEAIGRSPQFLTSGRLGPEFFTTMCHSLTEQDYWHGEIWNRRKSGEEYAGMLAISVVRDSAAQVQHYLGIFADISPLKAHEAELQRIAYYDVLTGVPNRRLLADRLNQAIAHAQRSGLPLAICYLDLDGFKPINDRFGHIAGDHFLVEITARLKRVLRAEDTLARLGGDEFVMLFRDVAQIEETRQILDRVLEAVSRPVLLDDTPIGISASIGVTLFPADDVDADTLLRHADQAMYLAKEAGKDRYQLFDPDHDRQVQAHREHQRILDAAMKNQEFVLYYQPKVDLISGEVVGAEALIRWRHPDRGLVPPGDFLQYLNGSKLEIVLGDWVIDQVLSQIDAWNSAGLTLGVSCNVSAKHLLQAGFAEQLQRMMERYPDVDPGRLEIEILETAALADLPQAVKALTRCRELGVRFALDDFGTGYSSLTYFRGLPVESLKIDQSFVRDMLNDEDALGIVESVLRLARTFNRAVIAEGVETLEHGAKLIHLGCRLAQGYGIAHPMPAEQLPDWVSEWQDKAAWLALNDLPTEHDDAHSAPRRAPPSLPD